MWLSVYIEGPLRVLKLIVEKPFLPQQRTGVNHVAFKSSIPRDVESYCHELRKVKSGHGLVDIHLSLAAVEVYMAERASKSDHIRATGACIGQYIAAHLEHDIRVRQ